MPSDCKNTLVIKGDVINFILDHKLYNNDFYEFIKYYGKRYKPLWKRENDSLDFFLSNLSCDDVNTVEKMMLIKKPYLDMIATNRDELELLDFSVLIPIPLEVDTYDWCTTFWGTKWNPNETTIIFISKERIEIKFETIWNPPVSWLKYASKHYDYLCFDLEYSESGNDFYGHIVYEYGEETKNISSTHFEFLKTEPNLNRTLNTIKRLPFKYNYNINEYINIVKEMLENNIVEIDDYSYYQMSKEQTEIYEIIQEIWNEYIGSVSDIYYDINSNFHRFIGEILKYYSDIRNTINIISTNRIIKNIKKWSKLNKINREIIEFGYLPEDSENKGTILGIGGYHYRECKEHFYSLNKNIS